MLAGRGYAILARRVRTRAGEIDIVARDGPTLVFVEVKARRSGRCGAPEEAVTALKRRRLARLASQYLARHGLTEVPCRFDVVAVDLDGARARVTVFPGAFAVDT